MLIKTKNNELVWRNQFFTEPFKSDETIVVRVPPGYSEHFYCHHSHTDQLICVSGELTILLLENGKLIERKLDSKNYLVIPPKIPHSSRNDTDEVCIVINALIRHKPPHPRDYTPMKVSSKFI